MSNPFHIFLRLPSDEVIYKQALNLNSIADIKEFMLKEFGQNNYYIFVNDKYSRPELHIINKRNHISLETSICEYLYDREPLIFKKFFELFNDLNKFNVSGIIKTYLNISKTISKPITFNNWKYKIEPYRIELIFTIDPTKNKKYVNWLCKLHYEDEEQLKSEDYDKVSKLLIDFDKPNVKALIKKTGGNLDIVSYSTHQELYKQIYDVYYSQENVDSKTEAFKKCLIFEDNDWSVLEAANYHNSKLFGTNTYWCTAADSNDAKDNFNMYTDNGEIPLIIFINKHTNKKYQWAPKTDDFLDNNDNEFGIDTYFSWAFWINFYRVRRELPGSIYYELIKRDLGLDLLVTDNSSNVRYVIAKKGYGLDILLENAGDDIQVLSALITQGYKLNEIMDKLSNRIETQRLIKGVMDKAEALRNGELEFYTNKYGHRCLKDA